MNILFSIEEAVAFIARFAEKVRLFTEFIVFGTNASEGVLFFSVIVFFIGVIILDVYLFSTNKIP